MTTAKRAAIWTRVSTQGQEDGTSLDTQLDACRALCAENGWTVAAEYRIVHSIKYIDDIPEWQALKPAISRGEIDVLVVHKADRIAGHPADISHVFRHCEHHDVEVEFVEGEVPHGEFRHVLIPMVGHAGHKRLEWIIQATRDGREAKMTGDPERGRAPRPLGTGRAPYGLRYVREHDARDRPMKRRFEADPETIDAVRAMFQWYDEGASLRELDRRLRARGITPPDHHRTGAVTWSLPTLRGILMNENYTGVGYVWTTDRREVKGKRIHRIKPREEWIRLPEGTYPTVIDAAQFARVQARLTSNRHDSPPGGTSAETMGLLRRGIGVCAYCGNSLQVMHSRRQNARYRCSPSNQAKHGCPAHCMKVEALDAAVWQFVRGVLLTPGALERKLFGAATPDPVADALPGAEAEVTARIKERDRVLRRLRATEDDDVAAAYEADLKVAQAAVRAAEARRASLLAEREAWRVAQARRQDVLDEAASLAQQVDELDFAGQRNLLRRLGAEIRLYREADADPRWTITTRFTVGSQWSMSSNQPLVPSLFGIDVRRTVVFDDGRAGAMVALEDMTPEERAQEARSQEWWASRDEAWWAANRELVADVFHPFRSH